MYCNCCPLKKENEDFKKIKSNGIGVTHSPTAEKNHCHRRGEIHEQGSGF